MSKILRQSIKLRVMKHEKIEFIDQTIRDAQQSLWGYLMRTDHMTPIAEAMDKVGYRAMQRLAHRHLQCR